MTDSPPAPTPTPPDRLQVYRDRRDQLNQIELERVLEALSADPNQDGDHRKWKVASGNIIVKGQLWKNVNTDIHKGYGGVSLVRHALDFAREVQAMDWIASRFTDLPAFNPNASIDPSEAVKPDFDPPDRLDDLLPQVRSYLVNDRGLPPSLVAQAMESGVLYASRSLDRTSGRRHGEPWCVFLGTASAEIREIAKDGFKGCCTGSDTDHSGFRLPHVACLQEKILGIQEAAVDSFSYRALFPGRFAFSSNGSGRFNLHYRLATQAIDAGIGVRMALDADFAGDSASQRVFNSLFLREHLSRTLEVPPEQIDAWFLAQASSPHSDPDDSSSSEVAPASIGAALAAIPGNSPHELFFNTGWQPSLPVHEATMVQTDRGLSRAWESTGRSAQPAIGLQVLKSVHPALPRGQHWFPVSKEAYDRIRAEYNLYRDRTPHGKDWNDALRHLGTPYQLAYEVCARQGFQQGPPSLSPELEAIRSVGTAPPALKPSPSLPVPGIPSSKAHASTRPTRFRVPSPQA